MADAAINPETKSDFFEFERRWLCLARGFQFEVVAVKSQPAAGW
jgi:hypothetical protein